MVLFFEENGEVKMEITKEVFGELNGKEVLEYTLTNSKGYSLSVTNYGAIITKLMMPDKEGNAENITVNFETLDEIVASRPFHGAIIGPVSGRISGAAYKDGHLEILLEKNENGNNLHSGSTGIDQHIWNATTKEDGNQASLILNTVSLDGESGFPGDLEVTVTYSLNEKNEVALSYEAKTNKRTLFNPTNHVYFNLNGNSQELIHNHELQVNSEKFAVLDDENIPTGELRAVEGTDFDLRKSRSLEEVLNSKDDQIKARKGYDHPFVLNKEVESPAIILEEPNSGRVLELKTDESAIVIYTHNSEKAPVSDSENTLPIHAGITLETCALPNAVNQEGFGSVWLEPGETFHSTTVVSLKVETAD